MLFELTQKYLNKNYDAEDGSYKGNIMIIKAMIKYQNIRWWIKWNKEQPSACTKKQMICSIILVFLKKTTI